MTTATPKRRSKPAEPQMTLEEMAGAKLRETLEQYRHLVAEAADGEQFFQPQLEHVAGLLEHLRLPAFTFDRDVQALRKYRQLEAEAASVEATRQQDADEAKVLNAEIAAVTRRLAQARGRLHELTVVRPQLFIGLNRRLGELEVEHPHLLARLAKAMQLRLAAQQRQAAKPPREGWLP
jgi:septal ring factor EnvC (AmiA/AmiB activator)